MGEVVIRAIDEIEDQAELEALYSLMLSLVVKLAKRLGKPCPIVTRQERRGLRVP